MLKRVMGITLAIVMLFLSAACGGSPEQAPETPTEAPAATPVQERAAVAGRD
jgi:hypothetical protein